jgi:hypothetical protein
MGGAPRGVLLAENGRRTGVLGIRVQIWLLGGLGLAALAVLVGPVLLGTRSPGGPGASGLPGPAARVGPTGGPAVAGAAPPEQPAGPAAAGAVPMAGPSEGPAIPVADGPAREPASAQAPSPGSALALLPRDETREQIALEERARKRARELGVELPPDVRDAIRSQQPLPGEDELAFAERLRALEREAISDEFLTEALLWERHETEIYRWGVPTSHHRAELAEWVENMTAQQRQPRLERALDEAEGAVAPRFFPVDKVPPYEGPGAEPPPEGFRWAEPGTSGEPILVPPR